MLTGYPIQMSTRQVSSFSLKEHNLVTNGEVLISLSKAVRNLTINIVCFGHEKHGLKKSNKSSSKLCGRGQINIHLNPACGKVYLNFLNPKTVFVADLVLCRYWCKPRFVESLLKIYTKIAISTESTFLR